jgi:hypothetical protein
MADGKQPAGCHLQHPNVHVLASNPQRRLQPRRCILLLQICHIHAHKPVAQKNSDVFTRCIEAQHMQVNLASAWLLTEYGTVQQQQSLCKQPRGQKSFTQQQAACHPSPKTRPSRTTQA